jgi:transcriptional regulator with PAS, ATPase and Fis domain
MLAEGGDKYDQAVKKIRTVLAANRGRIQDAAAKLHVSSRTLSRWIKDHNIQKFASELRKKHSVPGPRPT